MITDFESVFKERAPWPPEDQDTNERLSLYAKNAVLYKGKHNIIWDDFIRKLRDDRKGDLRLIINFHKLLSRLWSDLVCGEIPDVSTEGEPQLKALKRIIRDNMLWLGTQDGVIDYSKNGTNIIKIRFNGRGIIENVPPKYWFPVVSMSDVKTIKAHIIAFDFSNPKENEKDITYLKVEIHRPPALGEPSFMIEHRIYKLKARVILGKVPLNTFEEFKNLKDVEPTGLMDFDIIDIQNKPETDQLFGNDDYCDINPFVKELELRYAQIFRIEDKFADPSMYGPPVEEQDPRDGNNQMTGGSRYFRVMKGETPPGVIDGRGPPVTSYTTIDHLMQRLYEITETCKVAFDASQSGSALSGTALRLMMSRPLAHASGIKLRYDAKLKLAIRLCSQLEVINKMPEAVEIQDFQIVWKDGLPNDPKEEAEIDSTLVTGRVRSAAGLMRERGKTEKQINDEKIEMAEKIF